MKGQRKVHLALSIETIEWLAMTGDAMGGWSLGKTADYVLSAARSTSGSMAVLSSSSSEVAGDIARSPDSQ